MIRPECTAHLTSERLFVCRHVQYEGAAVGAVWSPPQEGVLCMVCAEKLRNDTLSPDDVVNVCPGCFAARYQHVQ
jgi:hypothetical protein